MEKAKEVFQAISKQVANKDIIAKQIEDSILNKEYLPGSKLPSEAELGSIFGVSRTSIREALQILNLHGLVSIEKGRGVFVKIPSSSNVSTNILKFLEHRVEGDYIFDLIQTRQIFEPGIAYLAALNRTKEDLEKLEKDIYDIKNNMDIERYSEYNMSFHMHLAYASKNKIIPLLLKPLHKLMPIVKASVLKNVDDPKEAAVIWHTKIFENVRDQNAVGAQETMIAHLKIAVKHAEMAVSTKAKKK